MGRREVWACLAALLSVSAGCGKTDDAKPATTDAGAPMNAAGEAPDDPPGAGGGGGGTSGGLASGGVASSAGHAGAAGVGDFDGGAAGGPAIAMGSFGQALMSAYCDKLFDCASVGDDDIAAAIILGSKARCAEQLARYLEQDPAESDLRSKMTAGSIGFAPDAVAACLDEMRSCGFSERGQSPFALGPKCRAVYVGRVAAGGACRRSEDCADDARCVGVGKCAGSCVARKGLGEPCESTEECDDRSAPVVCTLGPATTERTCRALTRKAAALGEPCTRIASAGQTEIVDCAEGLWCDSPPSSSSGVGACRARLMAGASCDAYDDFCALGSACLDQRCQVVTVGREPSASCERGLAAACDPFARLVCVDGACQRPGDGSAGSACGLTDMAGLLQCDAGLRCAEAAGAGPLGTCLPLLADGQACARDGECESGTCDAQKCTTYCALQH